MTSASHDVAGDFAYAIGEEVVAHLCGTEVFSLEHAAPLPAAFRPEWTIATVMERTTDDGERHYALRLRLRGYRCVATVPESAIEGVA
jgi:hypothetical protein